MPKLISASRPMLYSKDMVEHKPQQSDAVDKAFHISLILKGLDGLIEVLSGLALLVIRPHQIEHWANSIAGPHPTSFVGTHLTHWANNLGKGSLLFGAIYLLSHGLVKIFVVVEVWRNRSWAYPLLLVVIGLFIAYQLYYLVFTKFTAGMVGLTIFDFIVVGLTWVEYQRHKARHNFADERS